MTAVNCTREQAVNELINFCRLYFGVYSSGSIRFTVTEGNTRCLANRFIPANTRVIFMPASCAFDSSMLYDEFRSADGDANMLWRDLRRRFTAYNRQQHKDTVGCASSLLTIDKLILVLCIVGLHQKLKSTIPSQRSLNVQCFDYYWNSMPSTPGSVLFDWAVEDYKKLMGTSVFGVVESTKKYIDAVFSDVVVPFIESHIGEFGGGLAMDTGVPALESIIDLFKFRYLVSIVMSRTFECSSSCNKGSMLLPLVDMINGTAYELSANVALEVFDMKDEVNKSCSSTDPAPQSPMLTIITTKSICAGDELFLQYCGTCSSTEYLLSYGYLPCDPEIILRNPRNTVALRLHTFLDQKLKDNLSSTVDSRCISRNSMEALIERKKKYFYHSNPVPYETTVSMEQLLHSPCTVVTQLFHFCLCVVATTEEFERLTRNQTCECQSTLLSGLEALKTLVEFSCGSQVEYFQSGIKCNEKDFIVKLMSMSERSVLEVFFRQVCSIPEVQDMDFLKTRAAEMYEQYNCRTIILSALNAEIDKGTQERMSLGVCVWCGAAKGFATLRCSRCKVVCYCSSNCQKLHWKFHKKQCKKT